MKDLTKELISKELLEDVLGIKVRYYEDIKHFYYFDKNALNWETKEYGRWRPLEINTYELVHKHLKQYTKDKNLFNKIDWSEEPKDILLKVMELRKDKGN